MPGALAGGLDGPLLANAAALVQMAICEDIGTGDITSRVCLPADAVGEAAIVARQDGVAAGLWLAGMVYGALAGDVRVELQAADGQPFAAGQVLGRLRGPVAGLLTGERVTLNFLQHLGGVATMTRRFVEAICGTRAVIVDTRKTTPGWRRLEKYAVRCGGGRNHRLGLYDELLIKDNHLALAGRDIAAVVGEARRQIGPRMRIEVEVDNLEQLRAVLPLAVDYILLDNMTPAMLRQAVAMRDQASPRMRPLLEASGGVNLSSVRAIAESGVDRISVGALTHSAPAVDIAIDIL